jgi:hypothetical protein
MGVDENLHDYLHLGPPNALDSVTADEYAALGQAAAWIASTAALFTLRIAGREATAQEPLVDAWSAVSGYAQYTGDSPSSGFPTVVQSAPGAYTITAASSYNDDAGVSGDVAFRFYTASMQSAATFAELNLSSQTVLTVDHKTWSSGANASDKTSCVEIA